MALVRMTDLKDQRLNPYLKLTDHQLRNALESERGVCICESEVAIRVALAEGVQPLSLLVEEKSSALRAFRTCWLCGQRM